MKERVTYIKEHHPVEKEFVVSGAELWRRGRRRRPPCHNPCPCACACSLAGVGVGRGAGGVQIAACERGARSLFVPPLSSRCPNLSPAPFLLALTLHHPCPQVETRATGQERETGQRAEEHMGAQERVVEVAQPVVEQPSAEYFTKVGAWLAGRLALWAEAGRVVGGGVVGRAG